MDFSMAQRPVQRNICQYNFCVLKFEHPSERMFGQIWKLAPNTRMLRHGFASQYSAQMSPKVFFFHVQGTAAEAIPGGVMKP